MKVLVACEESQEVCKAFRERGHEAYSADLQECSGGHPEWHIQGDVLPLINGNCDFITVGGVWQNIEKWDLVIAHPPCTHLAVSGARWFPEKQKDFRQQKACVLFMQMMLARADRVAVENPIGIMSNCYRKPDQIIQPYQFGHATLKATCLWLRNLPKLKPTKIVEPEREHYLYSNGKIKAYGKGIGETVLNGRILAWNDPMTAKLRSKTFTGIAQAMAEQWGDLECIPTVQRSVRPEKDDSSIYDWSCGSCGFPVAHDDNYCNNCGIKINWEDCQ